jgi:adenylyltransferase/sulfurtransferase
MGQPLREEKPMVNVYIPTPFRSFVGNRSSVAAKGSDITEVLADLDAQFPGFRNLCSDESGNIPAHINVYVNNKEISTLEGISTRLNDGDQVAVIPALAGGAVEEDVSQYALTPERVTRYSRHIIMPQVGSTGQRKIFNSKVLIVGAGGLGSPISVYLALAGVGTIGLVDFDVVDLSNLQRQILHQNDDIG